MYRSISTVGSALLWVLLPKCGLCLMAYVGIFSALGLGGLVRNNMMLPIIITLMAVNLGAVIYMSVVKKEYAYAVLCFACAILLAVNKIYIGYAGINILTGLVLLVAMLRIRLFRLTRKTCVFKQPDCV